MTTKRFTLKGFDGVRYDLFDGDVELAEVHKEDAKELCNLLNELSEENTMLKERRHEDINELSVIAMKYKALEKENKQLKEQLSEAKADEKQLGISFMGYKMKLIEVLQKKYDKVKGKTLYADVYTEIAEEMGVDLE